MKKYNDICGKIVDIPSENEMSVDQVAGTFYTGRDSAHVRLHSKGMIIALLLREQR